MIFHPIAIHIILPAQIVMKHYHGLLAQARGPLQQKNVFHVFLEELNKLKHGLLPLLENEKVEPFIHAVLDMLDSSSQNLWGQLLELVPPANSQLTEKQTQKQVETDATSEAESTDKENQNKQSSISRWIFQRGASSWKRENAKRKTQTFRPSDFQCYCLAASVYVFKIISQPPPLPL